MQISLKSGDQTVVEMLAHHASLKADLFDSSINRPQKCNHVFNLERDGSL